MAYLRLRALLGPDHPRNQVSTTPGRHRIATILLIPRHHPSLLQIHVAAAEEEALRSMLSYYGVDAPLHICSA